LNLTVPPSPTRGATSVLASGTLYAFFSSGCCSRARFSPLRQHVRFRLFSNQNFSAADAPRDRRDAAETMRITSDCSNCTAPARREREVERLAFFEFK
jgi:hypothetical protein